MAESQKRFRRSRKDDDDAQQFALTDRDRELAELAAEILPRNSAAASFERHAARAAGSTSAAAREAVTDHGHDAAATPERTSGTSGAAAESQDAGTALEAADVERGGRRTSKASRRAKNAAVRRTGATAPAETASSSSAAANATESGTAAAEPEEETPAELKARRKRELAEKRREARAAKAEEREARGLDQQPTPTWYKVVMVGMMVVALLWIISYYLFQGLIPIPGIGVWNLVIGLGFMLTGLIMTTRWR